MTRGEYRSAFDTLYRETYKLMPNASVLERFTYIASKLEDEHLEHVIERGPYTFVEPWINVCKNELAERILTEGV